METMGAVPKRYLSVDDVALYIDIPVSSVYRLVEAREIPFILVGKARLRFDIKAIDKWMERRAVPAKSQVA